MAPEVTNTIPALAAMGAAAITMSLSLNPSIATTLSLWTSCVAELPMVAASVFPS